MRPIISPAWAGLTVPFPPEVLAAIADEVWRRTKGPFYDAERTRAQAAIVHARSTQALQEALTQLVALNQNELEESRHQAVMVGQDLRETVAPGYEAWCQSVMARLRLIPMGEAEVEKFAEQVRQFQGELTTPPDVQATNTAGSGLDGSDSDHELIVGDGTNVQVGTRPRLLSDIIRRH